MINIREFLGLGYYTSELDKFLSEIDQKCQKLSASQRQEIEKYARLNASRDNPDMPEPKKTFWDKF